jgi:D-cysteine desulfhydrase
MSRRPVDADEATSRDIPLFRKFPDLARIPRVALGRAPTPVESLDSLSPDLWIKRDDLAGTPMGGNKVRALEFLLANVARGDVVATVGSAGSTHALAVATYCAALGAEARIGRWHQEMNPAAERVAERISRIVQQSPVFRTPLGAYAWATRERIRGARWIAAGGSTPLGVLGHVNAGLELVEQIDAGALPEPARVVVPLGTGGTAAGLALAFAIADRRIAVVGARVVPRLVARRSRVERLARRTASLIEKTIGVAVPSIRGDLLLVAHETYGGAYGRETASGRAAAKTLHTARTIELDATYSAKAFAFALALPRAARGPTLFWLTFDSRIFQVP